MVHDRLRGLSVVICRARDASAGLAKLLCGHGAQVIFAPLIEVHLLEPTVAGEKFLENLGSGGYDWLAFTSSNGVKGFKAIEIPVPESTRIAAVGQATAAYLRRLGWSVEFVPQDHSARSLATELPAVADSRVLCLLGTQAGPNLTEGLAARGLKSDRLDVYSTTVPELAPAAQGHLLSEVRKADALVLTSSSTVHRFVERFGRNAVPRMVVCIGPQTLATAKAYGIAGIAEAEAPSDQAIVKVLCELAR
jgi:uroporphyrinogen-III synthase